MPIHKVKGGFKWGTHGHTYPTKTGAARQAAAAFANGYRGMQTGGIVPQVKPSFMRRKFG